VFSGQLLLVSRGIFEHSAVLTLATSGRLLPARPGGAQLRSAFASWGGQAPGSTLGFEQIGVNIPRLPRSIRAMRARAAAAKHLRRAEAGPKQSSLSSIIQQAAAMNVLWFLLVGVIAGWLARASGARPVAFG